MQSMDMTKDELAVLRRMDEGHAELQRQVGAIRMHIRGLEAQEAALCQQLGQKQAELQGESVRVASAHGVDPNDPTRRWRVNVATGRVERVQ